MADLTGKKIANTYKDLLQINASASNSGVDGTLRRVQDGAGTNSSLSLSQNETRIHGNLTVDGTVSAAGFSVDGIDVSVLNAVEVSTTRLAATSITTDKLDAGTLVFQDVSVSSLRTGDFKAVTVSAGTISATTVNATNILVASEPVATSSTVAALSATLETRIAGVSSTFATTSATLESRIAAVSVLTKTKLDAVASVNTIAVAAARAATKDMWS